MKMINNIIDKVRKVLFGYTTPRCVGIDISSTAIKMLELAANTLDVINYSITPLGKNMVTEGVINDIDRVSEIIRAEWDKLKPQYSEVAISIPYNAIVLREVTAPLYKSRFELDAFVKSQLARELENEDIDFDYLIKNQGQEEQTLGVVVAKKEKIEEYQAIIQMTGMKVAAIDIEPFALQYLFESVLLKKIPQHKQVLIIDLGANKIRAFVFFDQKLVLFNEISINYYSFFEDIIIQGGTPNQEENSNIYQDGFKIMSSSPSLATELVKLVAADVAKLLQMIKSSMLVEKKVSLSENAKVYLIGGNSLIPGLLKEISGFFATKVAYATELLGPENKKVPTEDLLRLFTAIALATWGHKIDKN